MPDAPGGLPVFWLILFFLIAAGLQSAFAGHLSFAGGQPDFVMTLLLAAALLSDAGIGSVVGFCGGLLTASLVGETVGTYIVTRVVAGFVAGWFSARLYRAHAGVVIVSALAASFTASLLFLLAAPRTGLRHFHPYLNATLIGAVWNALLAVPASWLLRRCGWGQGRM